MKTKLSILLNMLLLSLTVSAQWTQKANFGGGPRANAIGFCIGAKGYIGTGVSAQTQTGYLLWQDFWEYHESV